MKTREHNVWHKLSLAAALVALVGAGAGLTAGCSASGEDPGTADPALNPQPLPPIDDGQEGSRESQDYSAPPEAPASGAPDTNGDPKAEPTDAGTKAQPQSRPPCTLPGLC